ncbi:ferritin-like domain-containing protein [Symmachiella dynata]|uniref:ferritin-like domain-containing protein n=1 Tax=Symmachiella dynata TaxID=2527995 RepID=UPI0018D2F237|nr:ferritin-like domain-containing protein [Symmachiella dynata]
MEIALQLEHATIPPYLCALYSIKHGTNDAAADRILSVAKEEMLHMALVANLLLAIGGTPKMSASDFVLSYPGPLPESDGNVVVSLNCFSPKALESFLDIERPTPIDAEPQGRGYSSIGQFYASIKDELDYYCRKVQKNKFSELFIGNPDVQTPPEEYYSGGGEIVEVTDYDSARRAIKIIVDEGEGFGHTIFSGDHEQFGEEPDLAHFYKFNELLVGRRYLPTDSPDADPTGPQIAVDYSKNAVHHAEVLKDNGQTSLSPGVQEKLAEFQQTYSDLLRELELGFTSSKKVSEGQELGEKATHFREVGGLMFKVKYQMTALMHSSGGGIIPAFK